MSGGINEKIHRGRRCGQVTLLSECLDDCIDHDNPVRVVEAFVEELQLQDLGFKSAEPPVTGRPSYHPRVLLKIYIYGYLNRIQSGLSGSANATWS